MNSAADSFTGTFTGAILRGKYRLGPSIGRGGMGEVFEATQLATGAPVAIKVVSRHLGGNMTMARLQREAEAARRVQSEFIPRLYDIDSTADGELFLVMERLHGETLAERLRRREGNLSWEETRVIGEHVLRGLVDAHAAGVVHRDLKPGNIFIECASPDTGGVERTRILDFGVCKLDAHDGESLTSTGEAVGTISYMAPEQIRGAAHVDHRADIYSFAMVVFEALSGRLAHDASGQIAMIASKLERPARHLRDAALVSYPNGLDELLARCLSRRLDERVATATDLLRAWRLLGRPIVAPTPHASFAPMPEPSQTDTGMTSHSARHVSTRSTRLGVVVAACAFAASCVVLAVALLTRSSSEPAPASSFAVAPPQSPDDSTRAAVTAVPSTAPATPSAPSDDTPSIDPASLPIAAPDSADPRPQAPPAHGKAHRHGSPHPSSGATPPGVTGPQIAVKPRY